MPWIETKIEQFEFARGAPLKAICAYIVVWIRVLEVAGVRLVLSSFYIFVLTFAWAMPVNWWMTNELRARG